MTEILLRDDTRGVAILTMNAPERLNALSDAMLAALQDQIDALAKDRETRVVILKGAGKAFCAGHDLKEMQAGRQALDGGRAYFADLFARCARVMTGLMRLPQPVIAAPHGIATAAGCQLVASCDLAVAAEGTRFGVNGVNIGLFCSTPMVALTRTIPRKHAFEMLTTGQFVDTGRAEALGLINRAVPADMLDDAAWRLAETLAGKLSPALRVGKGLFYDQLERGIDEAYSMAGAAMVENMMLSETEEGIGAFLEKRPPAWQA